MNSTPHAGLFIGGTDTGIGKTHVACLIVHQLRSANVLVGAYKPVCSGAIVGSDSSPKWDDVERLHSALGGNIPREAVCPQTFLAPLAPPLAARAEGRCVDPVMLKSGLHWWRNRADVVVVEGAGGLLSPVTDTSTVADLACEMGFPLIVVARCGLGTINHSLLTLEAARNRHLTVAGVILNQCHPQDDQSLAEDNAREIEARGGTNVLGIIGWGSMDDLQRHGRPVTIRWQDLANRIF